MEDLNLYGDWMQSGLHYQEAETISEVLDYNAIFTQLVTWEDFIHQDNKYTRARF